MSERGHCKDHDETGELDVTAVRLRLSAARGRDYWRSLEELADTPAFRRLLQREFPRHAAEWPEGRDGIDRRQFLHLMAASLALSGLSACTKQPPEQIAPYVHQPEQVIPGRPLYFATAMTLHGAGLGVLVESHEGRPTKVEGNPDHPGSLGATDVFAQASVLDLYDPDRSRTVINNGQISSWSEFLGECRLLRQRLLATRGAGLRILTETVVSPSLGDRVRALLAEFPAARWHQWEPINRDNELLGLRMAFGADLTPLYRFDRARRVLALDADFLCHGPAGVRHAHDFAMGRRLAPGQGDMTRLYVVESTPTNTGEVADHRLRIRPSEIEGFARALAASLGAGPPSGYGKHAQWIAALSRDLRAHGGASLVIAGPYQSPAVHALAHAMNHTLGNVGTTVTYAEPLEAEPAVQLDSLRALCTDLRSGAVDTVLMLGGNPVYTAPADLGFAGALGHARLRLHLGTYFDETAAMCQWHVPEAHYLESWGDTRAYDGTVSIVQPLIAPLFDGRSAHEMLAALTASPERSTYEIVRAYWQGRHAGADFEGFWRGTLDRGIMPGTALAPRAAALRPLGGVPPETAAAPAGLEVVFRPDPMIDDGRFNNNAWLQEMPRPLSQITWDNVAALSPRTAQRLGLRHSIGPEGRHFLADVVQISRNGRPIQAAVWVLPGQPDDTVTLTLGYGRQITGRIGKDQGYNAYALRTSDALWWGRGVYVQKLGRRHELASVQLHFTMEGRDHVRAATLDQFRRDPAFATREEPPPPSDETLYPQWSYSSGYAWGMSIDLNACVGCLSCVIACQAENNIPVVGKGQVAMGREMHWLRVAHFYRGGIDDPEGFFQPIPCMQCENAPCELVCPVGATVHSAEGLNDMVYNRCVGTRYCSNNCPYKVRRFNFFLYGDWGTPSVMMQKNPDVTVRSRGVMEKCTYCVQRITAGRIRGEEEGRRLRDGEVLTACQQVCPTGAIAFGDLNTQGAEVVRRKADPRNYALLGDLNTRPRTTYLAAVRNPNPEVPPPAPPPNPPKGAEAE